jgi:hypothetical protein
MWRPPGPRDPWGSSRVLPSRRSGRGNRDKSPPPLCPSAWSRLDGGAAPPHPGGHVVGSCRGHHRGAPDARSGRGRRTTAVTRWPSSDKAPRQVWAALLDDDEYLCSISTMYRQTAGRQHRQTADPPRPADRPRRPRLVKGVQARGVPAGRPRGDQEPRAAALLQRQPLQRSEPAADPRGHFLSFGLPDAAAVHRACTTPAWSPTTAATCCASASGLPRPRGRRTGGGAARGCAPPRTAAEPPLPFLEDYLAA